jgi:nitroreductase
VEDTETHWNDHLYSEIERRQTQRSLSNERPVAAADIQRLSAAVESIPGAQVQWLTDPRTLHELGPLIGAGDRLRILHPVCHREMLSEIRWSAAQVEEQRDGIDVETLGLTPSDRAGMELCRDWAALQLVAKLEGGHNLEKMSAKQINTAAAVGLITVQGFRAVDYFAAGRAVQRMWLTATELGIGVHPMTALVYFFARVLRGRGHGFDPKTNAEFRRLRSRFEALFQTSDGGAEVFLFRIGHAEGGGKRSLRRPVSEVLRFE